MDRRGSSQQKPVLEPKLVFSMADHPTALQKSLHKQWVQGQNCDLVISAESLDIPLHSCVASCFSAKISHHLLSAELVHTCLQDAEQEGYSATEEGMSVFLCATGEKVVKLDIHQDLAKAVVGFMYTGSLSIPHHKIMVLLAVAKLLGMKVLISIVEVFIGRNPHVINLQTIPASPKEAFPLADKIITDEDPHNSSREGQHLSQPSSNEQVETLSEDGTELHIDGLQLDIKQEVEDADLSEFFGVSGSQKTGSGRDGSMSYGLSGVDLGRENRNGTSAVGKFGARANLVVKIEEKEIEDFPVHFGNAVLQAEGEAQKVEAVELGSSTSVHPSDDGKDKKGSEASDNEVDVISEREICTFNPSNVDENDDEVDTLISEPKQSCIHLSDVEKDKQGSTDNEEDSSGSQQNDADEHQDQSAVAAAKNRPFSCMYCNRSYHRRASVSRHVIKEHNHEMFSKKTCPHCDEQFQDGKKLQVHCKELHGDYTCDVNSCEFRTTRPRDLKIHKSKVHKIKHTCSDCGHTYSTRTDLLKHRRDKHSLFHCQICKRKFLFKNDCCRHQRTVHKTGTLKCCHCDQVFLTDEKLSEHCQTIHTDGVSVTSVSENTNSKPTAENTTHQNLSPDSVNSCNLQPTEGSHFEQIPVVVVSESVQKANKTNGSDHSVKTSQTSLRDATPVPPKRSRKLSRRSLMCSLCNKYLDSKKAHFQHLRDKHSDKCFSCQHCQKTFLRKEGLTSHVRAEHQGRRWTCAYCGEVFQISTQFKTHNLSQHGDAKPFACPVSPCKYRSAVVKTLELHKSHVHATERNELCFNCGSCFPSPKYLSLHQRSCLRLEQHLCSICGEVFTLKQSLKYHMNNKHGGERRYSCVQCGRLFSCHANRNRHMRIHNNAFPYVCETCGQKFRHSNSLKDHVRRKHCSGQ